MNRNDMADRLLREGMSGYATEVLSKMVAPHNIGRWRRGRARGG